MNRFVAVSVGALALLAVACSSGGTVASGDGPQPSETTVAPATTTTLPGPATSPALVVVGEAVIPDGEPGKLSVVLTGPLARSGSVPVVVRNSTSDTLYGIEASGTARGADGTLAGSGQSQGFVPSSISPGEWAFGYVYFGIDGAEGTTYEITAVGETEAPRYGGKIDATVAEVNQAQGAYSPQVVGILQNSTSDKITPPIAVDVACFDATGTQLSSTHRSFADINTDALAPGTTASFSIDLFDAACPIYAVGASGHSF